jgi:hypothetical protein
VAATCTSSIRAIAKSLKKSVSFYGASAGLITPR